MADDEELEYLRPGFDASSLTVARLRGILVQYEISYPSSAKKPDLVTIFNEQLVPRARKILSARARTQRTSRGITDMPSSQESTENGEVEEPSTSRAAQTPRRKARSSRQSTADTESTPVAKKTPGRKKTSTQSRASEAEIIEEADEEPSTARKARRSDRSEVKIEEPGTPPRRPRLPDSIFSDDNPFQSGSSPPSEDRRRSSGIRSEKRKSTSRRRKTDGSPDVKDEDGVVATSSRSLRLPVSRLSHMGVKVEPGEEFTPEEQLALEQDESTGGAIVRRPRKQRRTGTASAFWTVIMTVLIGYGFLWRKEKIELGYCGVGKRITAMQEYDAPEWLSFLQPACEPCPPHASCYSDMRVRCDNDFVLKQHPLSLNGAIPLPPTCEPDGEKVRKVHAVAEKAVEELREQKAKFECGEPTEVGGTPVASPEIEETTLKAKVSAKRRRGMSEEEFEDLWKGAIGEILGRDEVTSEGAGITGARRLSSSSLARLSITCAVRRSARQALARYRIEAAGLLALAALALFVRSYIRNLRRASARVPALVAMTLDRLATQAALHNQGSRPEPWMSAGRLRDDVLRDEFSAKRREDIWRRVQAVVEVNANVRSSVREDRNGEVSRVWEWIGSLPALDDDRRQSGRYSLPSDFADTPDKRLSSGADEGRDGAAGGGSRVWDEGRPIY